MVKQISDNEIYLLIKYIKSILWRVVKCLSYIQDARCLKIKTYGHLQHVELSYVHQFINYREDMCTVIRVACRFECFLSTCKHTFLHTGDDKKC